VRGLLRARERLDDFVLRFIATNPGGTFDALPWFKVLVHLEEVLNLESVEFGDVVDVAEVFHSRIPGWNTQHFVVSAGLVGHPEHPDGATANHNSREGWFLDKYECIEGITVEAQGVVDEAVVMRIARRSKEHAVQPDPASLVIHLVLIPATSGDLDGDVELHRLHRASFPGVSVSGMHRLLIALLLGGFLVAGAPITQAAPETNRASATAPTPAGVRAAVQRVLRDPALGQVSASVTLVATGTELLNTKSAAPRIPASVVKLLTAAAALEVFGATKRLETVVRQSGDVITIVGGGDATLVRAKGGDPLAGGAASLKDLAEQTARALPRAAKVRLQYDASAFTGKPLGPAWSRALVTSGNVAPVSALMVNEGRTSKGSRSRVSDPAKFAAQQFADLLRAEGVKVTSVKKGVVATDARRIAGVASPPMGELVERMLTDSLNDLAESLGHLVGGATLGNPSFAGGAQATQNVLRKLNLPLTGVVVADGSGLSSKNRIPPQTLNALLMTARTSPRLTPILNGLPIAGETGTLSNRFVTKPTKRAAGYVRAKTGTLTGVTSLSGTVLDRDGHVMVFTIIANRIPSIPAARNAVDRFATALAMCGCQS
jgi:serine-type D-Ala-D-Ala carboxypeptidase/endopeptidase (penicillin-binding protein 4)